MDVSSPLNCSAEEKRTLLALARGAIGAALLARPLPEPSPRTLTETLSTQAATFVTLQLNQKLRGCVGTLTARDPLYRSVMTNAVGAALHDSRFAPVTLQESEGLELHISILSPLVPVEAGPVEVVLAQITPHTDGVVLRWAGRTATFLPQVWEGFADKESFLNALSRKAGLESSAWKEAGAELLIYHVAGFGDTMVS